MADSIVLIVGTRHTHVVALEPCRAALDKRYPGGRQQRYGRLAADSGNSQQTAAAFFVSGRRVQHWRARRIVAALGLEFEDVATPI